MFTLKLHFMSQMFKFLTQSWGIYYFKNSDFKMTILLFLSCVFPSYFLSLFPYSCKGVAITKCYCRKCCKIGIRHLEDGSKFEFFEVLEHLSPKFISLSNLKIRTTARFISGILQSYHLNLCFGVSAHFIRVEFT